MLHCVTFRAMWQDALEYLRPRVGALHPIPMSDIGQRRCCRANIVFRHSFRTICTFLADFTYLSQWQMPRPWVPLCRTSGILRLNDANNPNEGARLVSGIPAERPPAERAILPPAAPYPTDRAESRSCTHLRPVRWITSCSRRCPARISTPSNRI
jgi:hypothetical protein